MPEAGHSTRGRPSPRASFDRADPDRLDAVADPAADALEAVADAEGQRRAGDDAPLAQRIRFAIAKQAQIAAGKAATTTVNCPGIDNAEKPGTHELTCTVTYAGKSYRGKLTIDAQAVQRVVQVHLGLGGGREARRSSTRSSGRSPARRRSPARWRTLLW